MATTKKHEWAGSRFDVGKHCVLCGALQSEFNENTPCKGMSAKRQPRPKAEEIENVVRRPK